MAKSSNYRVKLRRRREGKTDYQARKALVISGRPRLVTRTSIRNANAQIIIAKQKGDQVLASASSRELVKKYGWKAPTGNIPAAYLTGLLVGLKAKVAGVDGSILDIGLITPTKGARIFAILSGVVDAGIEIPHSEEKLAKDRLKGDHIARYAKELGTGSEEYNLKFSTYNAGGIAPEKVAEHFSKVRAEIVASFKGVKVAPEPESAPEPKAKPKPTPKIEPKVSSAPKKEGKAPTVTQTEIKLPQKPETKSAIKIEPKPEAKSAIKEEKPAEGPPKAKEKLTPKVETKEKVTKSLKTKSEKATKAKSETKEVAAKTKTATKEKTAKAKEAPKEKPSKKGEKK